LEYSIKKVTPMAVEVTPIDDREIPIPQNPKNRSRTGFSFSRFHIPALCGYRGRAIYMDADMQVFRDLTELWTLPMEGSHLAYADQPVKGGRKPQFSVLLMDCEALKWDVKEIIAGLDEGRYTYEDLMYTCCILPEERKKTLLPTEWNSLERYEPGRTRLLHYTDMTTQPWVSKSNWNGKLWYTALREAVDEGFIRRDELYDAVAKGNVSPDLPSWIGMPKPEGYREMKKTWRPPHRRFAKGGAAGSWPSWVRAWGGRVKRWAGF
jgi:hypothetical protein